MAARRKQRLAALVLGLALTAALVGVGLVVTGEPGPGDGLPAAPPTVQASAATTTLVAGTSGAEGEERLVWLTLFVHDEVGGRSAVAYVPARTAAEVPGRGVQSLADAFATGGMDLLLMTTENMLGAPLDRHLRLTEPAAAALFEGLSPLTVDVPSEVRVGVGGGSTRVLLPPGSQELARDDVVDLLFTVGREGDELAFGARHLALWDAVFTRYEGSAEELQTALADAGGALGNSNASPRELIDFFSSMASVEALRRDLRTLPVAPLDVPGNRMYVAEEAEVAAFVAEVVGSERLNEDAIRVQILNGDGTPGLGQEAAGLLIGNGFRVALTGNARTLDHDRTLIITYDGSAEWLERAERAKQLLGVGEVQVSAQEQGIVDLTIVVGRDFLRAR